jgi:hypothetical protein
MARGRGKEQKFVHRLTVSSDRKLMIVLYVGFVKCEIKELGFGVSDLEGKMY